MRSNTTLLLEGFHEFYLNEENVIKPLNYLPFVNKINILIGANNSGKSKFMRKLMQLQKLSILDENILASINELIDRKYYRRLSKIERDNVSGGLNSFKQDSYTEQGDRQKFNDIIRENQIPKCYYIPTLRTAHTLYKQTHKEKNKYDSKYSYTYEKIEDDIFLDTLRKNYQLEDRVEIFTGVHLYKDILNTRNSKRETRLKFESFENFIKNNFFDGKTIDIIAEFDKDEAILGNNTKEIISIHIEGEKESRDLHHMGDGIQALIVLMYKIFMADNDSFIFIDEPEINLHPGMQRLFLDQIMNNKHLRDKKLTYFLSTHSNHFMDLTLEKDDVSIYSFYSNVEDEVEKKLIVKNVNSGDNEVLKNIGVNNSSVFMANCSIWVEGISDRIYIKAFLKSYCKSINENFPKEDIDFAFFEYAGTNLSHYFFENIDDEQQEEFICNINAMALSNRILLLADSDNARANSPKGKRLKKLEDAQSTNFIPIIVKKRREIENFLPDAVWESLLLSLCNKRLLEQNRDSITERVKSALGEVSSEAYRKEYIGEFLNVIRENLGKISGKFIVNESEYKILGNNRFGTLTNKRMLSEEFSRLEFSWDILKKSDAIEKLTIAVYDFIRRR